MSWVLPVVGESFLNNGLTDSGVLILRSQGGSRRGREESERMIGVVVLGVG